MKTRAIFFDLDDTLYDSYKPFELAFQDTFPLFTDRMKKVHVQMRFHSDMLWNDYNEGRISLESLRMQRVLLACKDAVIPATSKMAFQFQQSYERYQQSLHLFEGVNDIIFTILNRGLQVGIITNGPSDHQWRKIKSLKLNEMISNDLILVSDEIGFAKPNPKIFAIAAKKAKCAPIESIHIGDSLVNDVKGAQSGGMQAIWYNHRNQLAPSSCKPFIEIKSFSSLLSIIENEV